MLDDSEILFGDVEEGGEGIPDSPTYSTRQEHLPTANDFQGPNFLIGAKYQSSLLENKILVLCLSKSDELKRDEKGNPMIELTPNEIKAALGLKGNGVYDALAPLAQSLTGRVMGITDPENNYFRFVSIISVAEYKDNVLRISFNNRLEDFLFRLNKNYTLLDKKMMMGFHSIYSFRMYEILRSVAFDSNHFAQRTLDGGYSVVFSVAELKLELGIVDATDEKLKRLFDSKNPDYELVIEKASEQKYRDWRDFRRFVLEVAQKELRHESDICFDFEPIRIGRKIKKVQFTIHYQDLTKDQGAQKAEEGKENIVKQKPVFRRAEAEEKRSEGVLSESLINDVVGISLEFLTAPIDRADAFAILKAAGGNLEKVRAGFQTAYEYPSDIENLTGFIVDAIKKSYTPRKKYSFKKKENATNPGAFEHNYDFDAIERNLLGYTDK